MTVNGHRTRGTEVMRVTLVWLMKSTFVSHIPDKDVCMPINDVKLHLRNNLKESV